MSKKLPPQAKNYTIKTIIKAIQGSGAIYSTIAKRLRCDWSTAKRYIHRYEETLQAFEDEEQTVLDLCEDTIIESINAGDTQDAKWFLSKKGKARGYGDKQEVEHSGEIKLPSINIVSNKPSE